MYYEDGIYMISIPEDDEIGPPQSGEEEDEDLDLTPLGRVQLKLKCCPRISLIA